MYNEHEHHGGGRHRHSEAHRKTIATNAGQTVSAVDPVCGMSVEPAIAEKVEFSGTTYYFCSAGCRAKFIADPDKYLKPEQPKPHLSTSDRIYTCKSRTGKYDATVLGWTRTQRACGRTGHAG